MSFFSFFSAVKGRIMPFLISANRSRQSRYPTLSVAFLGCNQGRGPVEIRPAQSDHQWT
jgi:hypothetical protein